jgi:hypothetical protein
MCNANNISFQMKTKWLFNKIWCIKVNEKWKIAQTKKEDKTFYFAFEFFHLMRDWY